jgi:hypothetical protein
LINNTIKRKLLALIVGRSDYLGRDKAYDGLMTFLSRIWPLRDMPSKDDDRYTNQYDNIFQHCINNADWQDEELYEDQLNLVNGDPQYFSLFMETVVSPETRNSREEYLSGLRSLIMNYPYGAGTCLLSASNGIAW